MEPDRNDWRPTADLSSLQHRSEIVWQLRSFFRSAGFWEVHTPVLSQDTILDRHIEPLSLSGEILQIPNLENLRFYLQTSPEFALKRLLSAGAEKIYQIAPAFRAGERGLLHNPEFTMVEWYRQGDDMEQGIQLLCQLVRAIVPNSNPQVVSYQSVFQKHVGACPLNSNLSQLCTAACNFGLPVHRDWSHDRDDWLNLLFAEIVQPQLGIEQPTIVSHYPASQSALALISEVDPRVAERFELFINGLELANGYHELLDPLELERRMFSVQQQRQREGKEALKVNSRLIAAMKAGLPGCSGCALGLDRLLMAVSGVETIDQVLCFPIERA